MSGPVQYRIMPMKSGIFSVRNQTEIMNADASISFLDADAQLRAQAILHPLHICGSIKEF
jgi:hypothetical protein